MWQLIKLESRKLFKDARLYAGAVFLCCLLWYGFSVRHAVIIQQCSAIDTSKLNQQKRHAEYLLLLDSVTNYKKAVSGYANDPRNPVYYSQRDPQFAHIPFISPGILANGQSDLYNEEVLLSARFRDPRIQKQDMANPLLVQFGQFDAAMVLVVLLPLFIIALSFNFLSGEKESGTLKLVAVQADSLKKWIWAKTILYGSVIFLIAWIACLSLMTVYGLNIAKSISSTGVFSLLLLVYVFFWQLLALWINSFHKTSAFNALALVATWLLFIFILPASINLFAGKLHKVPSRVSFINATRLADVEAERMDSSKLIDQYFYDHPELVKKDTTNKNRYADNNIWKEIIIQQEFINKKVDPIYDVYNQQLQSANRFAGRLGYLSPAGIMNSALLDIARTSSAHYLEFTDSAMAFRNQFLAMIRDKILMDKEMSLPEVKSRTDFSYRSAGINTAVWMMAILVFYCAILIALILQKIKKIVVE